MGAEGSTHLQVNFDRQNLAYFSGEQISGNITFQSTREKLEIDEIFLEIVGELGFTTQETRHVPNNLNHNPDHITNSTQIHPTSTTTTQTYTVNHDIPFLKVPVSVARPPPGQVKINK